MRREVWIAGGVMGALLGVVFPAASQGPAAPAPIVQVGGDPGGERALTFHVDQIDVNAGRYLLKKLAPLGKAIFEAAFTDEDGRGRPNHTGELPPRTRTPRFGLDGFNRVSGPEADSCAGCHNRPRVGGGGDNATNVFSLAERFAFFDDPSQPDENNEAPVYTLQAAGNERNAPSLFGAGLIEMLAREMTDELHAARALASQLAAQRGSNVRHPLVAKGVSFGFITAKPDNTFLTHEVEGVDPDLVIRPFGAKGTVVSIREFADRELFQRHGMQTVERFGQNTDSDGDGVANEITPGDLTALVSYIAQLGTPGHIIPRNPRYSLPARRGEQLFRQVGCNSCHVPEMTINSPYYTEPNPHNPDGLLKLSQVSRPFRFDLRRESEAPRTDTRAGLLIVQPFTDLKRHNMGNHPLMNSEPYTERGLPTNVFITRKLWGFYSEPHFLHNGRATRVTDAILAHGGEGQDARDRFAALNDLDKGAVIEYLKTFRVLPEGSRFRVINDLGRATSF